MCIYLKMLCFNINILKTFVPICNVCASFLYYQHYIYYRFKIVFFLLVLGRHLNTSTHSISIFWFLFDFHYFIFCAAYQTAEPYNLAKKRAPGFFCVNNLARLYLACTLFPSPSPSLSLAVSPTRFLPVAVPLSHAVYLFAGPSCLSYQ